jgi:hypothetical protein
MNISMLVAKHRFKVAGRVSLEMPNKLFDREFIQDNLYVNILEYLQGCNEPLIEDSMTLFAEDADDFKANIEATFNFVQRVKRSSNHVIMLTNERQRSGSLVLSKFYTIEQLVVAIDQRAQHDAAFEQGIKDEYYSVIGQNALKNLYL